MRATRLLDLIQVLRRHRYAVSGDALARELGVSLRTLYRDIASLKAQGAAIDGSPGVGYLLRGGFTLPPLMFDEEEIEALALGAGWVVDRAGGVLGLAARNALAKIGAVLPPQLREELETSALLVGPGEKIPDSEIDLAAIRKAIRTETKLDIAYRDGVRQQSRRVIWPFALAFFERARIVVAWCELRQDFRHFRVDRISSLAVRAERYPRRRRVLIRQWRETLGIPPG